MRIAIVDDERQDCATLSEMLAERFHRQLLSTYTIRAIIFWIRKFTMTWSFWISSWMAGRD